MTQHSYVLSPGAVADLQEITRYTLENWGEAQCRTYIAELETKAESVASGQGVYKEMDFILPGLRMIASGSHYIFCMPQHGSPAIILAILHERMDLFARLRQRLHK